MNPAVTDRLFEVAEHTTTPGASALVLDPSPERPVRRWEIAGVATEIGEVVEFARDEGLSAYMDPFTSGLEHSALADLIEVPGTDVSHGTGRVHLPLDLVGRAVGA